MKKSELLEAIKDLPDDGLIVIGVVTEKEESFEVGQEEPTPADDEDEAAPLDNGDGTETDFHPISDVVVLDDVEELDDGTERPVKFAYLELDFTDDEDDEEDGDDPDQADSDD